MTRLKLTDVELTGEVRRAEVGELWLTFAGEVREQHDNPTIAERTILRPIPHDGCWAVRQILARRKVCLLDEGRCYYYLSLSGVFMFRPASGCDDTQAANYMLDRKFWQRTDWQLYEEPTAEPRAEPRAAAELRERLRSGRIDVADLISDLWSRVLKLEAQHETMVECTGTLHPDSLRGDV